MLRETVTAIGKPALSLWDDSTFFTVWKTEPPKGLTGLLKVTQGEIQKAKGFPDPVNTTQSLCLLFEGIFGEMEASHCI